MKEKTQLQVFLVFLFIVCSMALSQASFAAITMTPTVEGYAAGMFRPAVTPAVTNGAFDAVGTLFINGNMVTLPTSLAPASNAASYAKNTLWSNPWLTGVALLAWPTAAGLDSDSVGGWQLQTSAGTGTATCTTQYGTANGATFGEACEATLHMYYPYWCPSLPPSGGQCHVNGSTTYSAGTVSSVYKQYCASAGGCTGGAVYGDYMWDVTFTLSGSVSGSEGTGSPTYRPATLDDFLALPDPPIAALGDMAPQVGVPVSPPFYLASDVPIGSPYAKPDGSTVQPRAKISPASTPGNIVVDTYDQPLTDASGNPVTNPTPQDTQEPQPSQCEKTPDAVGCHDLGQVPLADPMPGQTKNITFAPVSIAANATCPAPYTITAFGRSIPIAYDGACSYASGMHPIVIAVAYITALFIIFGAPRSAQS